jgi:hypothetical protein
MSNSKISALTSAATVVGTEVLPIVQSSATVKVTVANLTPGLGTITAAKGGTGQTSYAVGDILYADTTTTLAKLADVATGNALISGGVTTAPSWGKIGLTTHVSGTLPTANGGTNLTSFTANGIVYASSASVLATGSALVFDGTNLGIGVTPSAWNASNGKITQLGSSGTFLFGDASSASLGTNAYYNSGWIYTNTNFASRYEQQSGQHRWSNAPSGTAGNAITFTQAMTLDVSGQLGIGPTSPATKLDVRGTIQAAAAATQDAVRLAGRAGGTGTFAVTLTPTTLTASRTLTLPDATTTVVGTDTTQTLTNKTLSSGTLTGTLTAGGGVGTSGQFLQSTATGVQWAAATGVLAKQTDVFTSGTAATYTAPANTQWVKVTVVGGGGAGGALVSTKGSGGGGGGVAIKSLAMTAGQTLIYTVGGAGVSSTVVSGTLTITSIVGGLGAGGFNYTYGASTGSGGGGGTATGGDLNITGGAGGSAYGSSTSITTQISGAGGNCPGFGSGGGAVGGAITAGLNGSGYGGGGGGSIGSATAGSGASGVVIFEAF